MRCSSCEPLLDRYVEGTLTPREMTRVQVHLRTCARCDALLGDLRVVDALLATTRPAELAPNFTFAVMAEVRTARIEERRRLSPWAVLAFYVIGAWIACYGLYAAFGLHVPRIDVGTQALAALSAVARGFSPATPLVLGSVVGVLLLDALLIAGAVAIYRAMRARHAANASEAA